MKTLKKENYEIYNKEGEIITYAISEDELDEYACKTKTSDKNGLHTEKTRSIFCKEIGAKELKLVVGNNQWSEYEIIFEEK